MILDDVIDQIITCRKCPRLVDWREKVAHEKRRAYIDNEYWGKPVPGFGDHKAQIFIVGLAPGAHGSNRTGRQFTGDSSGEFLYKALHKVGYASQPHPVSREDGLILSQIFISAVCRCAPPGNKPLPSEIIKCQPYLEEEINILRPKIYVALGRIAYETLHKIFITRHLFSLSKNNYPPFQHNGVISLDSTHWLITSYHPSRQNTQTGKLTRNMFDDTWKIVNRLLVQA